MNADPVPFDFHDLIAELAETATPAHVDWWLMGTVARRGALPAAARQRLSMLVDAHRGALLPEAA